MINHKMEQPDVRRAFGAALGADLALASALASAPFFGAMAMGEICPGRVAGPMGK